LATLKAAGGEQAAAGDDVTVTSQQDRTDSDGETCC